MADMRIGAAGSSLVPQSPNAPGRSEAARAAQRAFFQAALAGAGPVTSASQKIAAPAPVQPNRADLSTPPTRMLRPGSLLDIKV